MVFYSTLRGMEGHVRNTTDSICGNTRCPYLRVNSCKFIWTCVWELARLIIRWVCPLSCCFLALLARVASVQLEMNYRPLYEEVGCRLFGGSILSMEKRSGLSELSDIMRGSTVYQDGLHHSTGVKCITLPHP